MIDRDTTTIEARLSELSPAEVLRLVGQVLGGEWINPRWRYARINQSVGAATGGIHRLAGTAEQGGRSAQWSCILKVITPIGSGPDQPTHPIYWKREALAYQSGWLDHLPGGLRAPRCFGVETQADGSLWLWLEDVSDRYGGHWPMEQYRRAARSLGRFNGACLAGEPWPPHDWLNRTTREPRGVLEAYGWIEALVQAPATWEHPLLRERFSASLVDRLQLLWREREPLLAAFERLPQTLCHQDAWRGNMMATGGNAAGDVGRATADSLVVIDWSVAGQATLGTDLGDLVVAGYGLWDIGHMPAEIDAAVFDDYLDGLHDAGWHADRNQVRFAYATYASLKYGSLLPWLSDLDDRARHAFWERVTGQPMASMVRLQAKLLEYLVGLYDEAVGLLKVI